jgi:hypothetical protein
VESNWATEHLQVIRTLMERSTVYRRALAPIMFMVGLLGLAAAALGWFTGLTTIRSFGGYWIGVGGFSLLAVYLMVRRQALKAAEPFWSPPTWRVTQALVPHCIAGLIFGLMVVVPEQTEWAVWWLLPSWMLLYGCAMHAAGFFMPRGMKLFGWAFIVAGAGLALGLGFLSQAPPLDKAHLVMGGYFGGFHLAYGLYLYFTEQGKNEA